MATLTVYQKVELTLPDGELFEIGSLITPKTLTLTNGNKYDTTKTIADNYGKDVLWATGYGGMDTFEVALVYSDTDVVLELKTDNATPEYVLIAIQGGVWHVLLTTDNVGGDTTESLDGAALVDGTDYDQIAQINVQNDAAEAAGDAVVRLILFD